MPKPKVSIYTDGGADPNPGPGGWGAVLIFEKDGQLHKKELRGGNVETTNNRMELTAALEALKTLNQPCQVALFTDSQYLQKGISEWMAGWKKNNFKNGKIQNADLWRLLDSEVARHDIDWSWVKGHASDEYNEQADTLASIGRAEILGHAVPEDALNPMRAYLAVSSAPAVHMGVWAVSLSKDGQQTILSGKESETVANHLYLLAAIAALKAVAEKQTLHLYINNDYLREGMKGWLKGWKRNGWRTKDGSEVKHRELWEEIDQLMQSRRVKFSTFEEDDANFIALKKATAELLKQEKGA